MIIRMPFKPVFNIIFKNTDENLVFHNSIPFLETHDIAIDPKESIQAKKPEKLKHHFCFIYCMA